MRWLSRMRMLLARRPWLYWSMIAVIAFAVAGAVAAAMSDVQREKQAWGEATTVLVVTRDVAAGEALAGTFATQKVPTAVVPPSAVTEVVAGATATQRLSAGEVVVEADVAGDRGPLALVPDDWLAIELPQADGGMETARSLFEVGDTVVVLSGGSTIAEDAIVVDVAADALAVAVPREAAARVAQAASERVAVLALSRP